MPSRRGSTAFCIPDLDVFNKFLNPHFFHPVFRKSVHLKTFSNGCFHPLECLIGLIGLPGMSAKSWRSRRRSSESSSRGWTWRLGRRGWQPRGARVGEIGGFGG